MERDIAIGRIIGILSNQIKRQFDSSASKTGAQLTAYIVF